MTRKLDLHTGSPVWRAYRAPGPAAEPLARDVKADVAIVGMGISAAMTADALSGAGLSVILIDRRGPMLGSTAATTALVQHEIDQPLSTLSRRIGQDRAERAWRRSRLAVGNLAARIAELGIDCRLTERPSLYLAGNVLAPEALRAEGEARNAAGLHGAYLSAGQLKERFGIDRKAALLSYGNLALDPRRLTAGLLASAKSRGARLHAPVEATTYESHRGGVSIGTKEGPVISATAAVLATGYELADIVPHDGHEIISTYAIATRPQPRAIWPKAAFMWEASDPYLYLRATHDGRIVCGGEDEGFSDEMARDMLIPEKTQRIAERLGRLLPGVDTTPDYAWAGAFGTTPSGLPLIGPVPGRPGFHAVLGYGGNGITFSRIASELITAALTGRKDRDADLFAFDRD
ncbi:FAD-dependent oxidoreductase [Aquibium sp. ELW1220]|uniref:NAD(P)/FAD-dependent oxidoreductase n=1 Tax=Aquibium sp. ELW1220 TaxID=2976766 RepID=UPI0025AFFB7D|nr:FAD-dependent oxidoreductase [Aquibium sp. ELW1220]MDN2580522.1 FAD-binding oxidoreductase [Aquibium sp. ELW1220]